jgi:hypothetical protein
MASTKQWMRFFLGAGIPPDSAAHYAITFEQNRMGLDMLLDLDKEYLRYVWPAAAALTAAPPQGPEDHGPGRHHRHPAARAGSPRQDGAGEGAGQAGQGQQR